MIEDPIGKRTRLAGITGPLTASEAFVIVDPAAKGYDADAFCHLLTAGERINGEGLSDLWELFYMMPNARAKATLGVGIDEHCDPDEEWEQRFLFEDVRPFAHHEPGNILRRLIRGGAFDVRAQWRQELERHAPLPLPFRDSPEAVRTFIAQGEDFFSGDIHLTVQTKTLATGEAVWWSMAYGVEYTTPFADGQAALRVYDGRLGAL